MDEPASDPSYNRKKAFWHSMSVSSEEDVFESNKSDTSSGKHEQQLPGKSALYGSLKRSATLDNDSSGAKPWSYRKYSHHVFSKSASMDEEAFEANMAQHASPKHHQSPLPKEDLKQEIARFVQERIEERGSSRDDDEMDDVEEDDEEEEDPVTSDVPEHNTEGYNQDSGYLSPSSSVSMSQTNEIALADPVSMEAQHMDLDELPIEAVDPEEYAHLLTQSKVDFPEIYTAHAVCILNCDSEMSDCDTVPYKVRLIVITAEDTEEFRQMLSMQRYNDSITDDAMSSDDEPFPNVAML